MGLEAPKLADEDSWTDVCVKCRKGEIRWDSPQLLCDDCWADWWVEGVEPESERIKYKEETLENMRERDRNEMGT